MKTEYKFWTDFKNGTKPSPQPKQDYSTFCVAMKINVVHKEARFNINVLSSQKIWEVKELISKSLNLNIGFRSTDKNDGSSVDDYEAKRKRQQFILLYNGGSLNDDCTVSEVGLVSGSTLRCRHIPTTPYVLKIHIKFLFKDIEVRDEISIENSTVGDLRTHIQNTVGIPVSVFNLQQVSEKRDLFDNRELSYYGIKYGDTLVLDVWKGTKELLISALNDDNSHTLTNVPNYHDNPILNRYYLKVALFIAAHHDFVNLAAQVLQRGGRCDEPVSEYPARQWCQHQSHPEVFKTPIHQAALRGSFRIINVFLRHSPTCIVAKDGYGRSPSIYASQNKHMECWKLLMVAQFQFQTICGFSLVIYSKIMRWCNKARDRVLYFKAENKKQLLLRSQLYPPNSTCLGEPIIISGFHGIDDIDKNRLNKPSAWSYNMNKKLQKTGLSFEEEPPPFRSKTDSTLTNKSFIRSGGKSNSSPDSSNKQKPLQTSISARPVRRELSVNTPKVKPRADTISDLSITTTKKFKERVALKRTSTQNAHKEAAQIIIQTTGKTPAQIATKCFQMGQTFDKMKWRSQMNIALKCSVNLIGNGGVR